VAGYGAIDVLAGAPQSPLVPVLPAGVVVPAWTSRAAARLGLDRLGPAGLVAVSLLVLGILLFAFGVVAWEAWRGRVALRLALLAVVASLALSVAAPLLLSRDVYSYAIYGRMQTVHHANPYEVPPSAFPRDPFAPVVSREWFDTRSVYGPAFTLASGAIARSWSPAATILAFKALAAAAVLVGAALAARIARRVAPGREALAVVLLGLNPVIVVHTVGGGHNDALVACLLAGAALLGTAALGDRPAPIEGSVGVPDRPIGLLAVGTTALITVAAGVKVIALLPLAYWWWRLWSRTPAGQARDGARWRTMAVHIGVAAALTAATAAPVFAGWRTVTAIGNLASRQGWASGARLVARGAEALGRALGGTGTGDAFGIVVHLGFLAVFALVAWRLPRTEGSSGPAPLWGSSLLLFALAAPYLLPWYCVWFLPFLAFFREERLALVGLAVAAVLTLTGVPAEPAPDAGLWHGMTLGVHYVVAPIVLILSIYAARLVLGGAITTSRLAKALANASRVS
jgi:alpha-1,6-mannosyltransferase